MNNIFNLINFHKNMKYLYSTLLLIIISFSANAQLNNGLKQIGGSVSISHSTSENDNSGISNSFTDQTTNAFSITPSIGYFIKDNVSLNLSLGYSYSNSESERIDEDEVSEYSYTTNNLSITISSRLHKSITDQFYLFLQPGASLNLRKYKDYSDDNDKNTAYSLGIRPGILYMANDRFAFEGTFGFLGYTYSESEPLDDSQSTSTSNNNNFRLDLSSITLDFGFRYYFK